MDYNKPAKLILDGLRFRYRGESFKGSGFLYWHPAKGFRIEAFLDKIFAPIDLIKTAGQIFLNTKEDTFGISLNVRRYGRAYVPAAFPNAQKHTFPPDNHLSMKVQRVIFFSRRPYNEQTLSKIWSGSAEFVTAIRFHFPDHLNTQTTLGGKPFNGKTSTALHFDDGEKWIITGRFVSDDKFELSWDMNKNCWHRKDVWCFGEAARRSLSIISAQTVWIAKQTVSRNAQKIEELRRPNKARNLSYYFQPMLGKDMGVVEDWKFNKVAFLKLTEFFLQGGLYAETCWKIFCQMADASRQKTIQGQELLLATILEAIFRTVNNRPFKVGEYYPDKMRMADMEKFRTDFLSDKWIKHCEKALELHRDLRHRNAHPDWLTSDDGGMSKAELKKSYSSIIFMSRFYGYMILGMAGLKDLEPLFPFVRFSEDK